MKKIIFFALCLCFSFSLKAQTSLSLNDIKPTIGDTLHQRSFSSPVSIPTPSGSNSSILLWDYSTLSGPQVSATGIVYDTSHISGINNVFPNAEFLFRFFTNGSYVDLFYSYSNGIELWGSMGAVSDTNIHSIPFKSTSFPINNSVNIMNTTYASSNNTGASNGRKNISFYGEGTLTLPNGVSYNNSILLKEEIYSDSTSLGSLTSTNYNWYVPGCPLAIMNIQILDFNNAKYVNYMDQIPNNLVYIKTLEDDDKKISLYPNPTSETISIKSDLEILNVSARGLDGKIIRINHHSNNIINVQNLISGFYFLEIETPDGVMTKKFIKK